MQREYPEKRLTRKETSEFLKKHGEVTLRMNTSFASRTISTVNNQEDLKIHMNAGFEVYTLRDHINDLCRS